MNAVLACCFAATLLVATAAVAENYASWPELQRRFPSTGGGGVMIDEYDPVLAGERCVTAFTATLPDGQVFRNVVEFTAVPVPGGTLCAEGRWRAVEGDARGTTPFRVFLGADGVRRGSP